MSLRLDHMNEYKVWKNMRARCSSKCNKDSVYQKRIYMIGYIKDGLFQK